MFQNHLAHFIQNAVMTGSISQIQTNRSLVLFENLDSLDLNSANLLHCRSPFFAPRARRSLGAYRIPLETGLLIPSDKFIVQVKRPRSSTFVNTSRLQGTTSSIKRPATQSVEYTTCTKTSPLKKPLPQVASRSANGLLAAISSADLPAGVR